MSCAEFTHFIVKLPIKFLCAGSYIVLISRGNLWPVLASGLLDELTGDGDLRASAVSDELTAMRELKPQTQQ
jgi:hypothetical protein